MIKVFKAKGIPKGKTNKQVNQKGNKKFSPKKKNDDKYAWEKFPPKQGEEKTKTMNEKT